MDVDTRRVVDKLAHELTRINTRLDRAEQGLRSVQLSRSSLEDTHLPAYDEDGNERQRIGKHTDGTFATTYANGPKPRTPSAPTIVAAELSLVVFYDGTLADGGTLPADVERVDIHESETAGFVPTGSTIKASLPPRAGARLLVLDNQQHHMKLVAVTTSNVPSDPSAEVSGTPLPVSDLDAGGLTGQTITGAVIQTDDTGPRVVLRQFTISGDPVVEFFVSGFPDPGWVGGDDFRGSAYIRSPQDVANNLDSALVELVPGNSDTGEGPVIHLNAPRVWIPTTNPASANPFPSDISPFAIGLDVGSQLRLDQQQILSVFTDRQTGTATQEPLLLNPGSEVQIGSGRNMNGIDFGNIGVNPDSLGNATISHNLGVTPATVIACTGHEQTHVSTRGLTSTDFTVGIWNPDGSAHTATTNIKWVAFA